jgi:tRNA dimethylallyltransferase
MSGKTQNTVLIVFGPTASGKSALALDVAAAFDGVVINADSMQVYRELRILTARPDAADTARIPHRLYGVLSIEDTCSAGRWRDMAAAEIEATHAAGRLPILCGGTGLYLKALVEGLSPLPDIPTEIRAVVRERVAEAGAVALHAELARRDPATAARLRPSDPQRIARALEVLEATGRPLSEWQNQAGEAPDWRFMTIALDPPRDELNAAIDERFMRMIAGGALEEARGLLSLDPDLPAAKAVGIPDLLAHLRGDIDRETAVTRAQQATRRYAKRQSTWLRTQIVTNFTLETQYSASFREEIFSFIRNNVLTTPA